MQGTYIGLMKKQIRNSQEQDNTKRLQQDILQVSWTWWLVTTAYGYEVHRKP